MGRGSLGYFPARGNFITLPRPLVWGDKIAPARSDRAGFFWLTQLSPAN